ncbi:uncharacterized protein LOC123192130 [Mangifera indica]|uniref:uncharacterized protein LOC123192130 n=1 Tax=Mangifera indica TaxID=29780 RepID=UPI001CFBA417|nr:uncharacterized protein LOC123192130 [Mangifera indica]
MASQLIENHRVAAEIYHGEALCRQKAWELLEEPCLPKGLFPIDMVEFGCNGSSGFVWAKHKEQVKHKFKRINKTVPYDTEVTAFFKKRRLTNVTGIKSKELLLWVTISNIFIDDPSSGKITFQVPNGMSAMLPTSAFELEENKVLCLEN